VRKEGRGFFLEDVSNGFAARAGWCRLRGWCCCVYLGYGGVVGAGGQEEGKKQDAGYRMQDAGYRMQDAGYTMQDTGCRMQDTGYRKQDAGYTMQDTGCRMPENKVLWVP